jgi:hypothetical protein
MNANTSVNTNANTNVFLGNENKALLWSVLHGGGKFNGIPDIQFKHIQIMFETTIREMGESYRKSNQHADLNGMNKEAVVTICKKMEMIKSGHKQMQPASQAQAQYQKKQQQPPQLQTIYKAEDIQKERQTAFNMELKKKEEEMASIITLRKPDEIKFTDDVYDRPIGDDMERLLAEALASRERELEQLTHVITATTTVTALDSNPQQQQPQQPQQPNSFNKDKGGDKEKHVSFGRVIEHDYANNNNNDDNFLNEDGLNNSINDADVDADLSSLFNKFKKINNDKKNDKKNVIDDNATNIIIKMSQDILDIKSILTELSERINKFNQ